MKLEGSCHCGAVRFEVESAEPCPYMLCYCGICRKTTGAGGFAINLGGVNETLKVVGRESVGIYRARIQNPEDSAPRQSEHERHFCRECGSHLWAWNPQWPDLVHPVATAVDTVLPIPPERVHIMTEFRPDWVQFVPGAGDQQFERYPEESLAAWHERHGLGQ